MIPVDEIRISKPIINCHTHIFTGDHVPPYLAKTFLPWPLYYLLPISLVIRLFRLWYSGPYTWQFKPWYQNLKKFFYNIKMFCNRHYIIKGLAWVVGLFITIQVLFIVAGWLSTIASPTTSTSKSLHFLQEWFLKHRLLYIPSTIAGKLLLILLLLIFFKSGRNLVWFIIKKIWSFLNILPGPQTRELANRYLNIGRFSFYRHSGKIFGRLKNQYPTGTGFIVLPMDMEYMDAGDLKKDYCYSFQMKALANIKKKKDHTNILFPFVFAEPRRMVAEGASHFNYTASNGKVILGDCFIKTYVEDYQFSGFKIYPALGYYPFDEALLPLWKYAADNGLPIITHCIKGTIYYRGTKKKEWDYHPVFEQACGSDRYEPMFLPEIRNIDFINNFTHPLNYLCLLDEKQLRKLVEKAKDQQIRDLFGFTDAGTPMKYNLNHLKLCFGHFGGDDEWKRFLELDRDNYASQLVLQPLKGIQFFEDVHGKIARGKPEQIWKYVDWYAIICSMMLQYDHIYADLSYIIHNPDIQPLLKQTLMNPKLNKKVLFGTDFYVVRNHKTEKNMLADILCHLDETYFDQIARTNPEVFLRNTLP